MGRGSRGSPPCPRLPCSLRVPPPRDGRPHGVWGLPSATPGGLSRGAAVPPPCARGARSAATVSARRGAPGASRLRPADGVHEDVPGPVPHGIRASERGHCEVCQVCGFAPGRGGGEVQGAGGAARGLPPRVCPQSRLRFRTPSTAAARASPGAPCSRAGGGSSSRALAAWHLRSAPEAAPAPLGGAGKGPGRCRPAWEAAGQPPVPSRVPSSSPGSLRPPFTPTVRTVALGLAVHLALGRRPGAA